ncbi:MAG: TraX family protein [Bacilli bacterium]
MMRRNYTAYQLKWLALITMAIDHFGVLVLLPYTQNATISTFYLIARLIGRLAFPLFAFMIAEGVYRSRNVLKYWLRLLAMAILIGSGMWALGLVGIETLAGNIFVDLSMAAAAMILLKNKNIGIKFLAVIPISFVILTSISPTLPNYISADYGIYGLVMMLILYLAYTPLPQARILQERFNLSQTAETHRYQVAAILLISMHLIWWLLSFIFVDVLTIINPVTLYLNRFVGAQTYAVIAGYFIYAYRGDKGNPPAWFKVFTYLFYPLHFVALYLLYYLTTL